MYKSVDDIVEEVKICIDEIGPNDSEMIGSQDNMDMSIIIRSKIIDALRYVNGNADPGMLTPDAVIDKADTSVSIDKDLVGHVVLPDNFMRLCYARFASWVMFLSEPIYWDDPEYSMLKDPYATGTPERPKLAMVPYPKLTLELYKAKDRNDSIQVGIMTEPSIINEDGEEKVSVSDRLVQALVYYIAGLTLLTYKDEHADSMFNQALVLMGISPTAQQNS